MTGLDLDRFISLEEAADRFGIDVETARRMVRARTFPVPVQTWNRIHKVSLRHVVECIDGSFDRGQVAS